jgi:hypothetical protein
MSLKDTTALYVSLMKSTKSPGHFDEYHEQESDETTADPSHDDDDVESDEDHTHGTSEELEGNTEHASLDQRHGEGEEEEIPVEQKLRQLTDNISHLDKVSSNDDENRQSFLSLHDLIKTLRPDDKPSQTASSNSRSQVLGEMPEIVFHPRKTNDNRSLFK